MTNAAVRIRLATSDDLDAVAALFDAYRQFYEQAPDLPAARAFISARMKREESVILVADDGNGALQGFTQLYPSFCSVQAQPICTLYDLYVAPAARRGGVGRQLMLAAEALAHKRGFARMDLSTARSNATAQSLYESLGWRRDEVYYVYSRQPGAPIPPEP